MAVTRCWLKTGVVLIVFFLGSLRTTRLATDRGLVPVLTDGFKGVLGRQAITGTWAGAADGGATLAP